MDWSQQNWISFLGILCIVIVGTSGHGRLNEPPSRVSAWRYGCTDCAQAMQHEELYSDSAWWCGGFLYQVEHGGKCGVCGDPDGGPYDSEAGGKFATDTIVRSYSKGSTVTLVVNITVSHEGYFGFMLCPVDNMNSKATQDCFDMYPLQRSDGTGNATKVLPQHPPATYVYSVEVVLPQDLTCTHCVMQWNYRGGQHWGWCDEDQTHGELGCGDQETFRACADICIYDEDHPCTMEEATTACTPPCVKCMFGDCQCAAGYNGNMCSEKETGAFW